MTSISIKDYFAAAGSRFTDADARVIGPVLSELASSGDIGPAAVVAAARSTNSPLHAYFEWDDEKAAHQYRCHQAGDMISAVRVRVVEHGTERSLRAYKVAKIAEPTTTKLPREIEQIDDDEIIADALRDLQQWRIKYRPYAETLANFKDAMIVVMNQVSEILDEFNNAPEAIKPLEAMTDLAEWAERHGRSATTAGAFAEHAQYVLDAIKEAEEAFDPDAKTEGPLARENRLLRERIKVLEGEQVSSWALRNKLGLTGQEATLVATLYASPAAVSRAALMRALYPDTTEDERPASKITDVFVCKVREKLAPRGIAIETAWGSGYVMPPDSKNALDGLLGEAAA